MEFLTEFGLFIAKTVTLVVALLVIVSVVLSAAHKDKDDQGSDGELRVRKLNEKYRKLRESLQAKLRSD